MDEDEGLHPYGKPLEPLDDDTVAVKKPIYAEDQICTDENGKRRFHGAFTGGFSAGYWNTVGSMHGWVPQMYKSSRTEKAEQKTQRPEDFMDDEDLGAFGIAPQVIQASEDFAKDNKKRGLKRSLMQPSLGPIPGLPVMAMLLKPIKDKAAVRILKTMGWRPGQGVGPRQTKRQKKAAKKRNKRELYVWQRYCDDDDDGVISKKKLAQSDGENSQGSEEDDDDEEDDLDDITFAPDDIEPLYLRSKTDTFGFGYTGLLGQSSSQVSSSKTLERFNVFDGLKFVDKNNKKISISGQAFGVGALEEEDEDIYARDDMTKYDFTLEEKKLKKKENKPLNDRNCIKGFTNDLTKPIEKLPFVVQVPSNFKPRNWLLRKSRFAPLPQEKKLEIEQSFKDYQTGRHNLDADKRGTILGEVLNETKTNVNNLKSSETPSQAKTYKNPFKSPERSKETKTHPISGLNASEKPKESAKTNANDRFMSQVLSTKSINFCSSNPDSGSGSFKPYASNEDKQRRYEKFLETKLTKPQEVEEFLNKLQPLNMSEWDRQMEAREFIQARQMYKPLEGKMSERFTSETISKEDDKKSSVDSKKEEKKIQMERTKVMWKPNSLLCKRYNIAEPFGGLLDDEETSSKTKTKSKTNVNLFDYLESSVSFNKKSDFQTPVIIPKNIEKPIVLAGKDEKDSTKVSSKEEVSSKLPKDSNALDSSNKEGKPEFVERKLANKSAKYVPKTKLEKDLEENKDKPLSEKTELYKALFADSDDEEGNDSAKQSELEMKKDSVLNDLAKELLQSKSAASSNLLRNNSPPRGIFKALFSSAEEKPKEIPPSQEKLKAVDSLPSDSYGPAPPPSSKLTNKPFESNEPPKIIFRPKTSLAKSEEVKTSETPLDEASLYCPSLPSHLRNKQKDFSCQLPPPPPVPAPLVQTDLSTFKWVEKKLVPSSSSSSSSSSSEDSESDSEEDSSDSSDSTPRKSRKAKTKKKSKKSDKKKAKRKSKKKKDKVKVKKREKKSDHKNKKKKKKTK